MELSLEALQTKTRLIVEEVEAKIGYIFDEKEKLDVLMYTIRKCQVNGKGEDYIPILYENELRDYVMRNTINLLGRMNREKKQKFKHSSEVIANV